MCAVKVSRFPGKPPLIAAIPFYHWPVLWDTQCRWSGVAVSVMSYLHAHLAQKRALVLQEKGSRPFLSAYFIMQAPSMYPR